jgi:small conductance mechanosensitive channel
METLAQNLLEQITLRIPQLGFALALFVVFWILSHLIARAIRKGASHVQQDAKVALLLARAAKIALITLGTVMALGNLGVDVSAIVTGLSLTGFALGFALRDTISNLLAGVLILLYSPFEIGNRIKISSFDGVVVSIDLRYTELDGQGGRILIPNSKLFTDPVTVLHETNT